MSAKPSPRSASGGSEIDRVASNWVARQDAGLTPTEHEALESWLGESPAHRDAFDRWLASWSRFDQPFDAGLAAQLKGELATENRVKKQALGVVLGAAFILGLGFWQWTGRDRLGGERVPEIAPEVVLMPNRRTLPDGSRVDLNHGAELTVQFSATERLIILQRGDAHFDVSPDTMRPFVVVADGVRVRAVGTAFTVARHRQTVAVVVSHGRVVVSPGGSKSEVSPEREVGAGARVIVSTETRSFLHSPEPGNAAVSEEDLAWRSPRVELTNSTLTAAVDLINRHGAAVGAARLRVVDPALATVRISGMFRLDRPDAFVELLEVGFGVRAEAVDGEVLLRQKR